MQEDRFTFLYFWDDGSINFEMWLPSQSPFILIRYSTKCQKEYSMRETELYVSWDDDNGFTISDTGGKNATDYESDNNRPLHFCYYNWDQYYYVNHLD